MKIIGPWFLKELNRIKSAGLHYDVVPIPGADNVDPAERFAFADLRSIAVFLDDASPRRGSAIRCVPHVTGRDQLLIEEASQLPYRHGVSGDPDLQSRSRYGRHSTNTQRSSSVDATSISIRTSSRSSISSRRHTRARPSTGRYLFARL
jgi:hypothetical protein